MSGPLCPVSLSDPRPTLYDLETANQAVQHNREALVSWSLKQGYTDDEDWVLAAVAEAFEEGKGEAKRALRIMELHHRWKSDHALIWHFEVVAKNMPGFLNQRIARWVVRTGMRFPGKPGDLIEFLGSNFRRAARIVKLLPIFACADIESEDGIKGSIAAEQVLANKTDSRAGQRYTVGFSRAETPTGTAA